jgi:hypothetical protein
VYLGSSSRSNLNITVTANCSNATSVILITGVHRDQVASYYYYVDIYNQSGTSATSVSLQATINNYNANDSFSLGAGWSWLN